ncbi:hypothetical protein Xinn_02812 [Xenorhabdus innexi]|uniref:Secreted protein n=1 Tax=Xenorhabdus innexi TaxID=290109 RepID=A0A2G0NEC9_9GAMM|nr:hypothetical protein Xinn_02812 [Xenorhabdus innexi]
MLRNMVIFLFIFLSYPVLAHYPPDLELKSGTFRSYDFTADDPPCLSNNCNGKIERTACWYKYHNSKYIRKNNAIHRRVVTIHLNDQHIFWQKE